MKLLFQVRYSTNSLLVIRLNNVFLRRSDFRVPYNHPPHPIQRRWKDKGRVWNRGRNLLSTAPRTPLNFATMVLFMSITFEDHFLGEQFLRNNRSTGQKSLRCFPRCCDAGHKAQGFCGAPIYATAILQKTSIPLDRVMVIGEIRPEIEPGLSKDVGERVPKVDVLSAIRSDANKKAEHRAELIAGEIRVLNETADTYEVGIVLNQGLHSYDYSWKSNRWASGTVTHVVDVIFLADEHPMGKVRPARFPAATPFSPPSVSPSPLPPAPSDALGTPSVRPVFLTSFLSPSIHRVCVAFQGDTYLVLSNMCSAPFVVASTKKSPGVAFEAAPRGARGRRRHEHGRRDGLGQEILVRFRRHVPQGTGGAGGAAADAQATADGVHPGRRQQQ